MKYGVIIKSSYQEQGYDRYDQSSTVYYNQLKEFDTIEQLEKYLLDNNAQMYSKANIVKIISFEELKAEFKVTVNVGQQ